MLAAGFGASSAVLGKPVIESGLRADQFAAMRITLAAGILLAGVALLRPSRLRVPRRGWPLLVVYGLLVMAFAQLLYFVAATRMPVAVANLLESASPVLVALWVRFVRRSELPRRMWLGISLVMTGLVVVSRVWDGLALDTLGLAAGAGAALCATLYYLLGEHAVKDIPPLTVVTWGMVVGAVAMCLVARPWTLNLDQLRKVAVLGPWRPQVWVLLIAVALLATVLPYLLGMSALRYLPVTAASVLALVEPIVAAALAWALLGERLADSQLVGGAVLLVGALIVQWYAPGKQPFEPMPPTGR